MILNVTYFDENQRLSSIDFFSYQYGTDYSCMKYFIFVSICRNYIYNNTNNNILKYVILYSFNISIA